MWKKDSLRIPQRKMMATVFACVPIIIIFLKGDDFKMLESFHQPPPSPHQHCVVWPECLISGHRFCYLSWIWFFKPLFFGGSIWRVHKDKETAVYVWRQTFASSLCSSVPLRWDRGSSWVRVTPWGLVCLSVSCSVHLEERKSLRGRSSALLRYSLPMQCRTPPLYSVGVCRLCCSAMYFLIRVMQGDSAAQQTSGLRSSASL